jgi:cellobiose-specific phosphotransferase system component IIA
MTKEEVTYKGLELVGLAGDARSNYLLALQAAKKGDFAKADALIAEGNEMIVEAHKAQTELIQNRSSRGLFRFDFINGPWSRSLNDNNIAKRHIGYIAWRL